MIGICDCGHHRIDHDEQTYPKIGFCYLCSCLEYAESKTVSVPNEAAVSSAS